MPTFVMEETKYELPPAGLHSGVCVDFIDEGFKSTQFGEKHKVRYVFQLEEQNAKGYRFTVSAWFNLSMHENSSLRQFLEQWRGRPFAEAEINKPPGFDLESVIGVPCTLNIVHNESGGKTYANIASISKHTQKLGQPLAPEGYTRVQDREDEGQTQAASAGANTNNAGQQRVSVPVEDDEVPF